MGIRSKAALVALLFLFAVACLSLEKVTMPERLVSDGRGKVLAVIALLEGSFEHVFVHSVHKSPVRELFRVEPEAGEARLRLYELRYADSGVGMPSDAENGYRLEEKEFVLVINRVFKVIPIRVSPIAGHGIRAAGIFHPFIDLANEAEPIVLTARIKTSIRMRR